MTKMSNILNDIEDDIEIVQPKKFKRIGWFVGILATAMGGIYGVGHFNATLFNRLDTVEKESYTNTKEIDKINIKIDKVYIDVDKKINEFRLYNDKQHYMIVDYAGSNKALLKKIMEINSLENVNQVPLKSK